MRLKDLESKAETLLQEEKEEMSIDLIKERIAEIEQMERLLTKAKRQYSELLEKSVDDVFYGE